MTTATTPATSSIPKRPPFNRETKSLIDSLGGGLESITPRSSRTARNSNPASPPSAPSAFRLTAARSRLPIHSDLCPRPASVCSEPPLSGSSYLPDDPLAPSSLPSPSHSPLALPLPATPALEIFPDAPLRPLPPKRKRIHSKSASAPTPGSDSSLSDLSDSDLAHRPPKKKSSRPLLRPDPELSIPAPLAPTIALTQSTPPSIPLALPPPQSQLGLVHPTVKPQRLILKPPSPQPPSSQNNSLIPKFPTPKLILPSNLHSNKSTLNANSLPKLKPNSNPNPHVSSNPNASAKGNARGKGKAKGKGKGKAKALQVPLLKARSAKTCSLRSRSTSNTPRSRRLTEFQKQEIEQKRAKLLAGLDEEEAMIKASSHPLLVDLQSNIERGRALKLRQAYLRHEALKTFLTRQHEEREERIWSSWADEKIRLRSELLLKCQLQLARAPFDFVMSNDTSNLQAMFHLTPAPKPAPFVHDVAHTISADSLVMGLERQRVKNHKIWTLPSSAIESDLALLRGTSNSKTLCSSKDPSHHQARKSPAASNLSTSLSTAPTQLKKNANQSIHQSGSSSSPYVPATDQAKSCLQHQNNDPSIGNQTLSWPCPNPSNATNPQIPQSVVVTSTRSPKSSGAQGSRPRKRVKSSQNNQQAAPSGPRRRSTRVQQLNSSTSPSSTSIEITSDQGTSVAPGFPTKLATHDIRGAIHSWAFPEASRLSPVILAQSSSNSARYDPQLDYLTPLRLDHLSGAGQATDCGLYRIEAGQATGLDSSPRHAHVPSSLTHETCSPFKDPARLSSYPAPRTRDELKPHETRSLSASDPLLAPAPSPLNTTSAGGDSWAREERVPMLISAGHSIRPVSHSTVSGVGPS